MTSVVSGLARYLALAYLAQTVARIGERLVPQSVLRPRLRQSLAEWLSTAAGIGFAFAADADVLSDLGLDFQPQALGIVLTGLIVGQGTRFASAWLKGLGAAPPSTPAARGPNGG